MTGFLMIKSTKNIDKKHPAGCSYTAYSSVTTHATYSMKLPIGLMYLYNNRYLKNNQILFRNVEFGNFIDLTICKRL